MIVTIMLPMEWESWQTFHHSKTKSISQVSQK
jgi:hypothetical protein